MTVKINADTSDGLKFVSDTSGVIDLQSNGVTSVEINSLGTSRKLKVYKGGGDELVLQSNAPDASGNMRKIELEGENVIFSTGASGGTSTTQNMLLDSNGNLKFNSGYGSAVTAYGVRAWVNFNGSGTPAARASGGVSSIGDRGTGKFTVNLSVTTPDVNGAVVATSSNNDTASSSEKTNVTAAQNSTSALYINLRDSSSNSQKDDAYINVVYLR